MAETMNELELEDFSVVGKKGEYLEHITPEEFHAQKFGVNYLGSIDGLFEFVKA